jgi:uncharacterized protein
MHRLTHMSDNAQPTPTAREPFHVMAKPTGPACNLECEYCFYLEKAALYPERSSFEMDDETLEAYVRQQIEAQPGPVITFAWQGGEPTLLGVDFFRQVVSLQEEYAPDDVEIENCLQTNGTLLDEEWCRFLAREDFLVGISIDGPRELHDRFRSTRADGPTFDRVLRGHSLLEEYGVEHNVLCVINAINSRHPMEVYRFFRDLGLEWIQFIPLVEPVDAGCGSGDRSGGEESERIGGGSERVFHEVPAWVADRGGEVEAADRNFDTIVADARKAPVSDRSVDPVDYGHFMCSIFDEWIRNDIGDISVRLFDQCIEVRLRGSPSLCVFDETCGSQVAMEHNGDVYACDHFVDEGFHRGNIHKTHLGKLVSDADQRRFGEYKRDGLPDRCLTCPVREHCNGGCPKNWHLQTPDGEGGLNYLCPGYRLFFTYVQPYLDVVERTLSEGLPPHCVRDAVATLDERSVRK